MEKRLYRNEYDKTIAGVASGLADYLGIDVTIVRVLFVLTAVFLGGSGVIAYIILWIVAPVNNDPTKKFKQFSDYYNQNPKGGTIFNSPEAFSNPSNQAEQTKWNTTNTNNFEQFNDKFVPKSNDSGKTIVGVILLVLGVYFLLNELNIFPYWFSIKYLYKLWPLAIVALGISLMVKKKSKNEWEDFKKQNEQEKSSVSEDPTVVIKTDQDISQEDKPQSY
jgi:phage shock protein C